MGLFGGVCVFEMHLGSLFISQLQRLHFKPWFSLDLLFKSHRNSSYYLLTASIVVFLLENPGTCIVHTFICQMSSVWLNQHLWLVCVFLYDWPLLWSLLCLHVTIWLACILFTTLITRCSFIAYVFPSVWSTYRPLLNPRVTI